MKLCGAPLNGSGRILLANPIPTNLITRPKTRPSPRRRIAPSLSKFPAFLALPCAALREQHLSELFSGLGCWRMPPAGMPLGGSGPVRRRAAYRLDNDIATFGVYSLGEKGISWQTGPFPLPALWRPYATLGGAAIAWPPRPELQEQQLPCARKY